MHLAQALILNFKNIHIWPFFQYLIWETWPQYQKFSWEISWWCYWQHRDDLYFVKTQLSPPALQTWSERCTHFIMNCRNFMNIQRIGEISSPRSWLTEPESQIWNTLVYCWYPNSPCVSIFITLFLYLQISISPFLESLSDITKLHLGLFG